MSFKLFSKEEIGTKVILNILGLKFSYKSKDNIIKQKEKDAERFYKLLNILSSPKYAPVATGKLRKDQNEALKLLKDVKEIFEENNIPYWLDYGTLLGAYRHKGFIPWDTDVDISAMREDIYKILPILREKYEDTKYEVREQEKTAHFQVRIKDKNDNNIGLDIFPMDKYPRENLSEEDKLKIDRRIRIAQKKLNKKYRNKKIALGDINAIREDIAQITRKIITMNCDNFSEKSSLFYGIDYYLPDPNLVRNYDEIFPLSKIEFEGVMFSAPKEIEKHLIYFFGKNYMKFPKSFNIMDRMDEYIENLSNS